MSISAIQSSGIYPAPEVQKAQTAPAAPAEPQAPAKTDRIVPEERSFDRYEPENRAETATCNTDRVDREIEQLKKQQEQLRSAAPEQAEAIQQQLDQVQRELAQKDNDTYRRQQAVFS